MRSVGGGIAQSYDSYQWVARIRSRGESMGIFVGGGTRLNEDV